MTKIRGLSCALALLLMLAASSVVASPEAKTDSTRASTPPTDSGPRDDVGDLNSGGIRAGDFPGSFKLPGGKDLSLAIGGFVKVIVIADTDAEAMGADFIATTLGTRRSDTDGAFNIESTLSRMFLDGRAPAGNGQLRGYIEWDLNKGNDGVVEFKMRHARGSWKSGQGTLLAGHDWSTMMDLRILPEGLTEPTVSGVIFMRQPEVRWSQRLDSGFTVHVAIEDPSSNDVLDSGSTPELGNTKLPDGVLGLEHDLGKTAHLRVNGIVRDLSVNLPGGGTDDAAAWGLSFTGGVAVLDHDRWVFSGVYGKGLGRYLLGIESTAGGAISASDNALVLRDNWGVMTAYKHRWTGTFRSTAMAGHAQSETLDWQPGSTFESSSYASANLMWQALPYMTMGVEYAYGRKEAKDGTDLDNHRVAIGCQFF